MNGIHDLGGMHGFGAMNPEPDEPVFHEPWEARAFALNFVSAASGYRNVDEFRHARERMEPVAYLGTGYYEHVLEAMERLLIEKGIISRERLEARSAEVAQGVPLPDTNAPHDRFPAAPLETIRERIRLGASTRRSDDAAPRFKPGQEVRVLNLHPPGHTRMPRYVRGRHGTIDRDHGVFVFPDSNALHQGARPQHVYAVVFKAREVWGREAPAGDSVVVDLWDDYLEPV